MSSSTKRPQNSKINFKSMIRKSRERVWRQEGVIEMDYLLRTFIEEYNDNAITGKKIIEFSKEFMRENKIASSLLVFHKFHQISYDILKDCAKIGGHLYEIWTLVFKKICCIVFKLGTTSQLDVTKDRAMCSILSRVFSECSFNFEDLNMTSISVEFKTRFGMKRPIDEDSIEVQNIGETLNVTQRVDDTPIVCKKEYNPSTATPSQEKSTNDEDKSYPIESDKNNATVKPTTIKKELSECGKKNSNNNDNFPANYCQQECLPNRDIFHTDKDIDQGSYTSHTKVNDSDDNVDVPLHIYGEFIDIRLRWLEDDFINRFQIPTNKHGHLHTYLFNYLKHLLHRMMKQYTNELDVKRFTQDNINLMYNFFITKKDGGMWFDKCMNGYMNPKDLSTYHG